MITLDNVHCTYYICSKPKKQQSSRDVDRYNYAKKKLLRKSMLSYNVILKFLEFKVA